MITLSKADLDLVMRSRAERADKAVVLKACGLLRRDVRFNVRAHAEVLVDYYQDSPPLHPVDRIIATSAAEVAG